MSIRSKPAVIDRLFVDTLVILIITSVPSASPTPPYIGSSSGELTPIVNGLLSRGLFPVARIHSAPSAAPLAPFLTAPCSFLMYPVNPAGIVYTA